MKVPRAASVTTAGDLARLFDIDLGEMPPDTVVSTFYEIGWCQCCHRRLTDPEHIRAKVGPLCASGGCKCQK